MIKTTIRRLAAALSAAGSVASITREGIAWEGALTRMSIMRATSKQRERAQMRAAIRLARSHTQSGRRLYLNLRSAGVDIVEREKQVGQIRRTS